MQLREWREKQVPRLTLDAMAKALAHLLQGTNPARTLHRYETGETQVPTIVAEAISVFTNAEVTPQDFHGVRLNRLRSSGQLDQLKLVAECGSKRLNVA